MARVIPLPPLMNDSGKRGFSPARYSSFPYEKKVALICKVRYRKSCKCDFSCHADRFFVMIKYLLSTWII